MVRLHKHKRFMSAARTTHLSVSASGASKTSSRRFVGPRLANSTVQIGSIVLEKTRA